MSDDERTDDAVGQPWLDTHFTSYRRTCVTADDVDTSGWQCAYALKFLEQLADAHEVCWFIAHDGLSYVGGLVDPSGHIDSECPSVTRAASLDGVAFQLAEYIREGDYDTQGDEDDD